MTTKHVVQQSRRTLQAAESRAESHIRGLHKTMMDALQPHLQQLYRDIADEQKQHEDGKIPLVWLYSYERLPLLTALIAGQVNHFAAQSQATVEALSHEGKTLGTQAGHAQIKAVKEGR